VPFARAIWRVVLAVCAAALVASTAAGQPTLRDLVGPRQPGDADPNAAAATPRVTRPANEAFDRSTPRATVRGWLAAAGAPARAARYLDLGEVPAGEGGEAARRLRAVLDRQLWIDPEAISADPQGAADDGLPPGRESLGWLETPEGPVEVLLERRGRGDAAVWQFSAETVGAAYALYDALGYGVLREWLPEPLLRIEILDVRLWQWVALLLLVGVAYLLAWAAVRVGTRLLMPLARRTHSDFDDRLLELASGPARLLVAVAVFSAGRVPLGLTVAVATVLGALEQILVIAAATWLVLRGLDVFAEGVRARLLREDKLNAVMLVAPGRRTAKIAVVGLAAIAMLDNLGFNVTALVAGLGVGGIAVALAAQKSVENLFGGVTLYADQPVRVGDFCRFGDRVGTIEDIGLRSTRIRTLERTLVSVPNGEFANLHLENFSVRDKFWYHPILGLRYETSPDQLRFVLVEVQRMLLAHPMVDPSGPRVRFIRFGAYSLDLEVFAYIRVPDFDRYLEVAEDLNLRIMDIVARAGSDFAFPSQTTYLESGAGLDRERARRAEEQTRGWRDAGTLNLPRFPAEEAARLRGTLRYPPAGAAQPPPAPSSDGVPPRRR
jgi:MscS family membrane protein